MTLLITTLSLLSVALVAWLWLGRPVRRGAADPALTPRFDPRWSVTLPAALLAETQPRPYRRLRVWLGLGWVLGFAAVLYRGPLPAPAPLWLAITGGWLIWRWRRQPAVSTTPTGGLIIGADSGLAHPG